MSGMTPDEIRIVDILGDAFNEFMSLPDEHINEKAEFCTKIHDLQRLVMARSGRREMRNYGKGKWNI